VCACVRVVVRFKPKLEELKAKMMSRTNGSKAKLPVQASKTLKLWFEQNLLWPYPEVCQQAERERREVG
jgi:hypothetical protein